METTIKPSLRFLERISLIVIIAAPIVVLVTIAAKWNLFQDLFPFPIYIQLKNTLFVVGFLVTVLFFLALVVFGGFLPFRRRPLFRSILLTCLVLIGVPMFCISGFLAISPDYLIGSAELNNHHYYVEVPGEFGDPVIGHYLYKCDDRDLNCEEIFMTVPAGGSTIYPASFITDDQSNEIHFFLGRELVYSDGPYPRSYHSQSFGMIETTYIYLYTYEKNSRQEFVISKCEGKYLDNNISCMLLPFQYATDAFNKAEIVTDESTNEIRMLVDGTLIFSYDIAPYCHVDGCVVPVQ